MRGPGTGEHEDWTMSKGEVWVGWSSTGKNFPGFGSHIVRLKEVKPSGYLDRGLSFREELFHLNAWDGAAYAVAWLEELLAGLSRMAE